MDKTINFFTTTISESAKLNVIETMVEGRISAGKRADLFEQKLSEYGLINPVTTNSGTVTMHLALQASGVGPGDEVIIPAQTFIATGLAVLYCGAKPVFADINFYDGNISVVSIREKITEKTKAIIPVHWGGYPCDMDEINQIAKEHNLSVIEDAAHAFGATYKGKLVGSLSRFTSFSFQAIKHLTTGDGGALCCTNYDDYNLVKRLRWFDIDRENSKVGYLGEREYNATNIGYKYHMNDIAASMGLGNLEIIDEKIERIRAIAKLYDEKLNEFSSIVKMEYNPDRQSSYWLYPILVNRRDDFIKLMKKHNIPVSVVHQGIDKNKIFGGVDNTLIHQRTFDNSQIHLPINDEITVENVEYIIDILKKGW
jgi:perosamine synthetase